MASQKILLILGAGSNIGRGVAERFEAAGYHVAVVSRTAPERGTYSDGVLTIQADLKDSGAISSIFQTVRDKLGGSPTVVVYNAAALTIPSDQSNIFSVPLGDFEKDLAVMNTSAYAAAGQAVAGFESSQSSAPKAFIYTGNILGAVTRAVPRVITLGTGKSAASYWIGAASGFYKDRDYRFYFADERKADGNSLALNELSGSGAGEFYLELAEGNGEIPWFATFVAGRGYVHFPDSSRM